MNTTIITTLTLTIAIVAILAGVGIKLPETAKEAEEQRSRQHQEDEANIREFSGLQADVEIKFDAETPFLASYDTLILAMQTRYKRLLRRDLFLPDSVPMAFLESNPLALTVETTERLRAIALMSGMDDPFEFELDYEFDFPIVEDPENPVFPSFETFIRIRQAQMEDFFRARLNLPPSFKVPFSKMNPFLPRKDFVDFFLA